MGSAPSKQEDPETSELATAEGTVTSDDYPPPKPPKTSKSTILSNIDFTTIDKFACNVPPTLLFGSFWDLIEHLVMAINFDVLDDLYRVRALFAWMTSFNVNNIDTDIIPPENSPLDYFMKIRWDFGDHAHLLYALCLMAKLPCVIINGVTKHGGYNIGDPIDRKLLGARWNAVLIDGEWRLIDVYWAISTVNDYGKYDKIYVDPDGNISVYSSEDDKEKPQRLNEAFFLADPQSLISTHFPDDPEWQLLPEPITLKQFERQPYTRERFYEMGMTLPKKILDKSCVLVSNGKPLRIPFDLPEKRSKDYRFRYTLLPTEDYVNTGNKFAFDQYVMMQHALDRVQFTLAFPSEGIFRFDIFGTDVTRSEPFGLVCSYTIKCKAATPDCHPLPDVPSLGWGPNPFASYSGLLPLTPIGAVIVTNTGMTEIKLKTRGITNLTHTMKSIHVDEAALSRYAFSNIENDICTISVRIPKNGEYGLNVYGNTNSLGRKNENLLSFLIRCDMDTGTVSPFPNVLGNQVGFKSGSTELGIKQQGDTTDTKVAKTGKITLQFSADNDINLYFELHTNNIQAKNTMKGTQERDDSLISYNLELPVPGIYAVNVFGDRNEENSNLMEIYSCIIHSEGYSGLPSTEANKKQSNKKTSNLTESQIDPQGSFNKSIDTTVGTVKIPIPNVIGDVFPTLRKTNTLGENEKPSAMVIVRDTKSLEVQMKVRGGYVLDLFSKESNGNMKTIGRYTISYEPDEIDHVRFSDSELATDEFENILERGKVMKMERPKANPEVPPTAVRPLLPPNTVPPKPVLKKKPLEKKDLDGLVRFLNRRYDTKPIPGNIGLDAWFDAKDTDKVREDISKACTFRQSSMLEEAIERAKEASSVSENGGELNLQIRMASRVLKTVSKVEKKTTETYSLNPKSMSEIKRYLTPPLGVHHVVAATFLLLGEDIEDLKEWSQCRRMFSFVGSNHVLRRMTQLDPLTIPPLVIQTAQRILRPFTAVQIREASKEAALLYAWVSQVSKANESSERTDSRQSLVTPRSSSVPEYISRREGTIF